MWAEVWRFHVVVGFAALTPAPFEVMLALGEDVVARGVGSRDGDAALAALVAED